MHPSFIIYFHNISPRRWIQSKPKNFIFAKIIPLTLTNKMNQKNDKNNNSLTCWILLSLRSDNRLATSLTSCAKLCSLSSLHISRAPVSPLSVPLSFPNASLNSVMPLSNCFHAIRDVVRLSNRVDILFSNRRIMSWIIKKKFHLFEVKVLFNIGRMLKEI